MEEIKNVNLTQLKPFKNHPFSVNFDKDFIELMKSIDKEGVIVPLLARPNPNGEGYELISRHRRKMVCEELGIEEIPVVIREMNDEQAIIAGFAREAREEGFDEIAELFEGVAKIEKEHEERYKKLLENIEGDLIFSRDGDCVWQCLNCGHIVVGKKAPEVCPVCAHPQAYFQIKAENY